MKIETWFYEGGEPFLTLTEGHVDTDAFSKIAFADEFVSFLAEEHGHEVRQIHVRKATKPELKDYTSDPDNTEIWLMCNSDQIRAKPLTAIVWEI